MATPPPPPPPSCSSFLSAPCGALCFLLMRQIFELNMDVEWMSVNEQS